MNRFEVTDQLLDEALSVSDRPSPGDLRRAVAAAVAASPRRRSLDTLIGPWAIGRWLPAPVPAWLVIATALLLAAMIAGALVVGSRLLDLAPRDRVENGRILFVARVTSDGLPTGTEPDVGVDVFRVEADGSVLRRLTTDSLSGSRPRSELSWSPDGSRIAFSPDFGYAAPSTVQVLDVATGRIVRVADVVPSKDPPFVMSWSPDSSRLAIGDWTGLQVASVDGAPARMLRRQAGFPTWSPDGTELAMAIFDAPEEQWLSGDATITETRLVVTDLATEDTRELYRQSGYAWLEPRWSPDGSWISFQGGPLGSSLQVDIVRPDGTGRRQLAAGWGATWSPDGSWVALQSDTVVWAVRPDDAPSKIADGTPYVSIERWAPDGESIVLAMTNGDGAFAGMSIVRLDGSDPLDFQPWPSRVEPFGWTWLPRDLDGPASASGGAVPGASSPTARPSAQPAPTLTRSPSTSMTLGSPEGLAFGSDGALYVSDFSQNRVFRVGTGGALTAVAGNGTSEYGGDGRPALEVGLGEPAGIAFDADGNLYIASHHGDRVLRVDTAGIASTFAGTGGNRGLSTDGNYGGDGGPATAARLGGPPGLAFDGNGNLVIADAFNHRVRMVDRSGVITTIAGSGLSAVPGGPTGDGEIATDVALGSPWYVAIGPAGDIYWAEFFSNRVYRMGADGILHHFAGTGTPGDTGDGGPATEAALNWPNGIAVAHDGTVFVSEWRGNRIRRIDPSGVIVTYAGTGRAGFSGDGGPAVEADLDGAFGLALDDAGNLYFADGGNGRVRRVDVNGTVTTVIGP